MEVSYALSRHSIEVAGKLGLFAALLVLKLSDKGFEFSVGPHPVLEAMWRCPAFSFPGTQLPCEYACRDEECCCPVV